MHRIVGRGRAHVGRLVGRRSVEREEKVARPADLTCCAHRRGGGEPRISRAAIGCRSSTAPPRNGFGYVETGREGSVERAETAEGGVVMCGTRRTPSVRKLLKKAFLSPGVLVCPTIRA